MPGFVRLLVAMAFAPRSIVQLWCKLRMFPLSLPSHQTHVWQEQAMVALRACAAMPMPSVSAPSNHCTCTEEGALVTAPAEVNTTGVSLIRFDSDLCNFACLRNYCPETACARAVDIYADSRCSADQMAIIQTEITHAISIASYAALHFQDGDYFTTFFSDSARTDTFPSQAEAIYNRVVAILDGTAGYSLEITCEFENTLCLNHVAHMSDSRRRQSLDLQFEARFNGALPHRPVEVGLHQGVAVRRNGFGVLEQAVGTLEVARHDIPDLPSLQVGGHETFPGREVINFPSEAQWP
ncbi:hypothetical protein N7490_004101 [Penicillium lividum]|nr:hypothetical protein N7490_004101 [Penicillium lividum]